MSSYNLVINSVFLERNNWLGGYAKKKKKKIIIVAGITGLYIIVNRMFLLKLVHLQHGQLHWLKLDCSNGANSVNQFISKKQWFSDSFMSWYLAYITTPICLKCSTKEICLHMLLFVEFKKGRSHCVACCRHDSAHLNVI